MQDKSNDMNTDKCPTCGAPAKMTWSGLELVAESGDETLASKHYEYQPNGNNNVSGKREIILFVEKQLSPQYMNDVFTWGAIERALENYFTACASGAAGTVAEGEECQHLLGKKFFKDSAAFLCKECGKIVVQEAPSEGQP